MSSRRQRLGFWLITCFVGLAACRSAPQHLRPPQTNSTPQIVENTPPPYRPAPYSTPANETVVGPGWTLRTKKFKEVSHRWKYSLEGQFPRIENTRDRRALKFNREIKRRIAKQYVGATQPNLKDFRDQVRAFPKEDPLETAEFDYEIMYSNDAVLSIRFHDITYSRGAAHPLESFFTLNYALTSGRIFRLKDVFKPKLRFKAKLEQLCDQKLADMRIYALFPESMSNELRNYDEWNITSEGLVMNFDRCNVAACAYGEISIVIPYQNLRPLLNQRSPAYKISSAKP